MKLPVPISNLNGNRQEDLLDSHCECLAALATAIDALACGDSYNGRNFQTHPDADAGLVARKRLQARAEALRRIMLEVECVAEAIADGLAFATVED